MPEPPKSSCSYDSDNDNREDVEVLLSEHASIALASSDPVGSV